MALTKSVVAIGQKLKEEVMHTYWNSGRTWLKNRLEVT